MRKVFLSIHLMIEAVFIRSRLKSNKIEDNFFKWNNELMGLCEYLGTKEYMTGDKSFPTTQEMLCDGVAGVDEERYIKEVIPWIIRDAFGPVCFTSPDSTNMEISHTSEFSLLEGSCSQVRYYLLGQLDSNKIDNYYKI